MTLVSLVPDLISWIYIPLSPLMKATYPENCAEQELFSYFTYLPKSEWTEIMARLEEWILCLRNSEGHAELDKAEAPSNSTFKMEHETSPMVIEANPLPCPNELYMGNIAVSFTFVSENPRPNRYVFNDTEKTLFSIYCNGVFSTGTFSLSTWNTPFIIFIILFYLSFWYFCSWVMSPHGHSCAWWMHFLYASYICWPCWSCHGLSCEESHSSVGLQKFMVSCPVIEFLCGDCTVKAARSIPSVH